MGLISPPSITRSILEQLKPEAPDGIEDIRECGQGDTLRRRSRLCGCMDASSLVAPSPFTMRESPRPGPSSLFNQPDDQKLLTTEGFVASDGVSMGQAEF